MHKKTFLQRLGLDLRRNYLLYLLILPVLAYYIIFHYMPMYGIQLAFKTYIPKLGYAGSPWVGVDNFNRFFHSYNFKQLLGNTIGISIYNLLVCFPLPIVFALLLNYMRSKRYKKVIQMVSYAPFFISVVVFSGMLLIFLQSDSSVVNTFLQSLGLPAVPFLSKPEYFKSVYVWSGLWQNLGFASIIYISALSAVDEALHEAAIIDGATKLRRIWHIDLPGISPTIIMLLILNMGNIMNVGFEKIFLLQNALNQSSSDVIATYIYRVGLLNNDYAYSTAVGLFNSVINLALLLLVNFIVKKTTANSLF